MEKLTWSNLNHLQIGKYGEYFSKMMFTQYGFDVFTSEVDDKGIDFVIRKSSQNYFEIQVKAIRTEKTKYVFLTKDKFNVENKSLYLSLVLFTDQKEPNIYLINVTNWLQENELFRNREYKSRGLKSKDEWGLNISKRSMILLNEFLFDAKIGDLR